MADDLTGRVRALERAVSESDDPPSPVPSVSDVAAAYETLDERVTAMESRVADLAARQQAVEAYVDHVEHVNESVERRADAALAAVDRLESTRTPSDASSGGDGGPTRDASDSSGVHVPDAASGPSGDDAAAGSADGGGAGLLGRLLDR